MVKVTTVKVNKRLHDKVKLICVITGIKQKQFVEQSINNEIKNYEKVMNRLKQLQKNQTKL